jgi:hypothetical protein
MDWSGKTVPSKVPDIIGMVIDLEDGQKWDDVVTLTMTREQAMIAMSACSIMLRNVMDGMEGAMGAADEGDILAIVMGPHLYQSAKDLQSTMRTMAETLLPALIAEVDKVDASKPPVN